MCSKTPLHREPRLDVKIHVKCYTDLMTSYYIPGALSRLLDGNGIFRQDNAPSRNAHLAGDFMKAHGIELLVWLAKLCTLDVGGWGLVLNARHTTQVALK